METLEFILPAISYSAVWPQIILVATALFVLLIDVFKRKAKTASIAFISLAGSMIALACLVMTWPTSGGSSFGGMAFTDGFSFFITLTVSITP